MKETALFVVVLATITVASSTAATDTDGFGEWQILTKQNLSSQIRLHPHLLLVVSTPWSGESRSLMKEITESVTARQEEFGSLKLMHMYRNKERMLADAVGATEEITVIYFHHSVSYKYNEKIRAKSILFSILPYLSASPEEIPLNVLSTEEQLREFVESTDKAVILFEFCGWTQKVLGSGTNNGTESNSGMQGPFTGTSFDGESNKILTRGKENLKVDGMENAKLKCGGENELAGVTLVDEFSYVNGSSTSMENDTQDTENLTLSAGLSCTFEEFQKFDAFFSSLMTVAREFFLPPEKHRFGLVSERSLLSSLGVGDVGSWSVMLYFSGCLSCSKILKEGQDLRDALNMRRPIVRELEGDGPGLDPAVPSNRPSVLLFVDRSSELLEIREKSKEALVALREVVLQYQISHLIAEDKRGETGHHTKVSTHPKLKLSPISQKTKLKDKMSIMIVNEGKHAILENIASDLQGSSLHEILTYLLQQKKEAKLSSVAKEAGFQLLSDDFNIKLEDTSPTTSELEFGKVSIVPPPPEEGLVRTDADLDKGSDSNHDKRSQNVDVISSFEDSDESSTDSDTNQNSKHLQPQLLDSGHELANSEAIQAEENNSSQVENMDQEELPFQSFKGSFFFSDGNYRLLKALTGETRIPSLVIIDPILQQHYVFPGQSILSYSSVENFLHSFLNRSIVPYQRSESRPKDPREGVHPPFVNLDFHEADSVPQVTSHTFFEQVLGLNHSYDDNTANAWNEDVVVLFSNSWCGFCQRMELIVREVYRAIKGYTSMLKDGSTDEKMLLSGDNIKHVIQKIPKIFLMDCTLNDCSFILKSMDQREVYPSLLLFPAERKTVIPYEGDLAIVDIINFIAVKGSYSQHLTDEKGVVWTPAEKRDHKQNFYEHPSSTAVHDDVHAPKEKDTIREVLLKNRMPNKVKYNLVKPQTSRSTDETARVVIGSVLIASEKIVAQPFDNSMVLIVKADQSTGFQGLIYNKPIGWDAVNELGQQLELLKEAPLSFGGPLVKRGMPLVALARRAVECQYPEVAPGIYYLDQTDTVREIEELKSGNQSLADFWFFLGFSRWGWNQLFDEIAEGAWSLSENSTEHLSWPL